MIDEWVSAPTGWRWVVVCCYELRFEGVQCVGGGPIGIRHLWFCWRPRDDDDGEEKEEGKEGGEGGEEEEASREQKTMGNGMLH